MFDKEKLPAYDSSPIYDERSGNGRETSYGGMMRSDMGEKAAPPKRFWTRAKIISAAVIVILLLGGIVCIYQNIAIQQRQYDVQGKIGAVWNEVDRASQLLQQDAALLNSTIASQNDAIAKIAQARSNVVSIKAGQGTGDTNAALAAANQVNAGIRVFVESYPDYGVESNTHSVLVQIEGSFNRIEYARGQLINTDGFQQVVADADTHEPVLSSRADSGIEHQPGRACPSPNLCTAHTVVVTTNS